MRDSVLAGPVVKPWHVITLFDRDGSILMPGHEPVVGFRLVEGYHPYRSHFRQPFTCQKCVYDVGK